MAEALQELGDHIAQSTGDAVIAAYVRLGELMLDARPGGLVALITFLRDDPRCLFKQLIDVCGVDWPEREKRFDVVYNLLSLKNNQRVHIKLATDETTPVPSVARTRPACRRYRSRPRRHCRCRWSPDRRPTCRPRAGQC